MVQKMTELNLRYWLETHELTEMCIFNNTMLTIAS